MHIAALTITATLLFGGTTAVAASILTQERANAAAEDYLDDQLAIPATYIDTNGDEHVDPVQPTSYELDPCDLTSSRKRAYCDYTMHWSDGDACDGSIRVVITRRSKVMTNDETFYCDNED